MTSNAPAPDQTAGDFAVDPTSSTVTFRTKSMFGAMTVRGSFAIADGTVHVRQPPTASSVNLSVAASSFASGNDKRDHHVKSPDFLHADEHPAIAFTSTRIALDTTGHGAVEGYVTVRGTQAPVTVSVSAVIVTNGTLVADATAQVDRHALGVSKMKGAIARHINLDFHIVATAV